MYQIKGVDLKNVYIIRDLGVVFDTKLIFVPHADTVISKPAQMLAFRDFRNERALCTLYYAYVRSRLKFSEII